MTLRKLDDSHMGYLEVSPAPYLVVTDTRGETTYLPADLFHGDPAELTPDDAAEYVDGEPAEVEVCRDGILWRMTAPGYMDATDWTPAGDGDEAEEDARNLYGDDGDAGE